MVAFNSQHRQLPTRYAGADSYTVENISRFSKVYKNGLIKDV